MHLYDSYMHRHKIYTIILYIHNHTYVKREREICLTIIMKQIGRNVSFTQFMLNRQPGFLIFFIFETRIMNSSGLLFLDSIGRKLKNNVEFLCASWRLVLLNNKSKIRF